MSGLAPPTFRLLDNEVGWDVLPNDGLADAVLREGVLELSVASGSPRPRWVLPPRLAWQCERCSWWLGTDHGLYKLGPHDPTFTRPKWMPEALCGEIVAVGAWSDLVAVSYGERLLIFDSVTGQVVADRELGTVTAANISALGFMMNPLSVGPIALVADEDGGLHGFDLSGLYKFTLETSGPIVALTTPVDGPWAVVAVHRDGSYTGVPCAPGASASALTTEDLPDFGDQSLIDWADEGFCIPRGCFDWDGRPIERDELGAGSVRYARQGQYLTAPLDSGIPLCRWHRVRVDVDLPPETAIEVSFATTQGPTEGRTAWTAPPGPWSAFPAGDPHPDDWTLAVGAAGSVEDDSTTHLLDALLFAPAGQNGYLRIRLTGDGTATPRLHQVRLDMPRQTSASLLPRIYTEDPLAADFTERFLSLFDAHLETIDQAVEDRHGLLDAEALPDSALGWLARLLGTGFEAEMSAEQRRALVAAAPALYRRRGTPDGLIDTLGVLGIDAVADEIGTVRPWTSLGETRLGDFRLFGRSTARVRLGSSPIGQAPLKSDGNPDDDALLAGAHQLSVHVGPTVDVQLAERIVRSQTPAHLSVAVHQSTPTFNLAGVRLGLNTVLVAPEPVVVGATHLGRDRILQPRSHHSGFARCGVAVGPLY